MRKKKIALPCFGIKVAVDNGGGSITSDLHDDAEDDNADKYNAAVDAVSNNYGDCYGNN